MSLETIRVFVVDDHPMIRTGLSTMIRAEPDLELVGEASNGQEAVRLIPGCAPDVVLMDLVMPHMNGIEATAALHAQMPDTRFVILTSLVDPAEVNRAIDAGASGYLLKNASPLELMTVIRSVHGGRRVLAPEVTDVLMQARQAPSLEDPLTQRERELLGLMVRGLNNQEVAAELGIALPTVKFHVSNILGKLQVDNRTEAVLKALKLKLVPAP